MQFCRKIFLITLLTVLIFGFVSCNDSVEKKNSPDTSENIKFLTPIFQGPRLKNIDSSKIISMDDANKDINALEYLFPLFTGFNYSPAQSEYVYEFFGEKVRLILQNDKKDRFWGYLGDNVWWNTSKYIFEGKSDSIYIKIELSKDLKTCTYLSAFEFEIDDNYKLIFIMYSDNISISKDGSCCRGLFTNVQSEVSTVEDYGFKTIKALPVDWYCDKDINGLFCYAGVDFPYYVYESCSYSSKDSSEVEYEGVDLIWMDTSVDYDNIKNQLDFVSKYELPDVQYMSNAEICLKNMTTGEIKFDYPFFYDVFRFEDVQRYLKENCSENWDLLLHPKSDIDYCTVHFIVPEEVADIINIPDQQVKRYDYIEEPDITAILESEYIQNNLKENKGSAYGFDWYSENHGYWNFEERKTCSCCTELNLELDLYLYKVPCRSEYYDFDGNLIHDTWMFGEEVYFPKISSESNDWYWLVEWYDGNERKTLKRNPLCAPVIWSRDIGEGVTYIAIRAMEEHSFQVSFNTKGFGSAPSAQTVEKGNKVTRPTDPKAPGARFKGWYKDAACTTEWNFDTDTITARTTIYAKWDIFTAYKITVNEDLSYAYYGTQDSNPTVLSDFSVESTMEEVESAIGTKIPVFGPAGGYVFYKLTDGKDGYNGQYEGCSYLEAAKDNVTSGGWKEVIFGFYRTSANSPNLFVNGLTEYDENCTGTGIGAGKRNTILLREKMGDRPYEMLSGSTRLLKKFLPAVSVCLQYSVDVYKDWFLPSKDEIKLMYDNLSKKGIGNFGSGVYWSSSEVAGEPSKAWQCDFYNGKLSSRTRDWYINVRACRAF